MESLFNFDPDCTVTCRSVVHGWKIGKAVLSKASDEAVASYIIWLCRNYANVTDNFGRTALHFAASCGRVHLVNWLLLRGHANPNAQDLESGWTPLHRSIYYGHLNAAAALMKHGASVNAVDMEGNSPLDLALKNRVHWDSRGSGPPKDLPEVYAWGPNTNYNLAFENQHSPEHPEVVESIRRIKTPVAEVGMSKFHTVFVGANGHVFSCGHGHGGRLGHSTDLPSVSPKLVSAVSSEVCTRVAVAKGHTVMLMENGSIWTCGLNRQHQLGHVPPPDYLNIPKNIRTGLCAKTLGRHKILDVCVGKYHTVLYSSEGIFTCGLNGGQLGQNKESVKNSRFITNISPVSMFNLSGTRITCAAASDGATVFATTKGDIFLLHEYNCFKIATKQVGILKMNLIGGHLDPFVDNTNVLKEKGGVPLKLVILEDFGKLYLWTQDCLGTLQPLRCLFAIQRTLVIADFALNQNGILLITWDGDGYAGTFGSIESTKLKGEQIVSKRKNRFVCTTPAYLQNQHYALIQVQRLESIYRAFKVTSDPKGKNCIVLQCDPIVFIRTVPQVSSSDMRKHTEELLSQADTLDKIHDVVIQAGSRRFLAHRFILASRCSILQNCELQKGKGHEPVFVKCGLKPQILEQLLKFAYTDTCDLLIDGKPVLWIAADEDEKENLISDPGSRVSLKRIQEAARKAGMQSLSSRLDFVTVKNGVVTMGAVNRPDVLKFDRRSWSQLSDVCIISQDGKTFPCHKCILIARLEYFYCMLGRGWIEAAKKSCINFPFSGTIIEALLEYIYTDSSPKITVSRDASYICNVMIVADQFLAWRLKEQCEEALVPLLNLRNALEILELADLCNAAQLKFSCLEFISQNVANILETQEMCTLEGKLLDDLSQSYRAVEKCQGFKPFREEDVTADQVSLIGNTFPVNLSENYSTSPEQDSKCEVFQKNVTNKELKFQTVGDKRSRKRYNKTHSDLEQETNNCQIEISKGNNNVGTEEPKKETAKKFPVSSPIPIPSSKPISIQIATPSPAEDSPIWGDGEFPDLSEGLKRKENSARNSGEFVRIKKSSQKQNRKGNSDTPRPISIHQFNSYVADKTWGDGVPSPRDSHSKEPVFSPKTFSWGLSGIHQHARSPRTDVPPPSPVQSPKNPWTKNLSNPNSVDESEISFIDIVKDEKVKLEKLARDSMKTLQMIQLEDRAIEELLRYYDTTEEFVTVERIIPEVVAPVWKFVKPVKK